MLYFVDSLGHFQLTGAGLLLFLLAFSVFSIAFWGLVKKIFFYRDSYYLMKNDLDWIEKKFDKEFPLMLEKYYQSRKTWEKKNGFW